MLLKQRHQCLRNQKLNIVECDSTKKTKKKKDFDAVKPELSGSFEMINNDVDQEFPASTNGTGKPWHIRIISKHQNHKLQNIANRNTD